MRYTAAILLLAASTVAATAQTPANSATAGANPAAPAAKTAVAEETRPAVMPTIKGEQKTLYTIALRYTDEVVGTGATAEAGKLLKFQFTMWQAANGAKIDSSLDHPGQPLKDKDGKPVLGDDGKPKLGDPQPGSSIMGAGRPFAGWDLGFDGMKVGGKRRIYIPWQLGLGNREIPARGPNQAAIPAKSDLIIDVELVDVADAPKPPARPAFGGAPGAVHTVPPGQAAPGAAVKPGTPATPAAAPAATPAQPQSK